MALSLYADSCAIVELSMSELFIVSGGSDAAPQKVKPGTCPDGYTKTAKYDAGGNLTGVDCTEKSSSVKTDVQKGLVQTGLDMAAEALKKKAQDIIDAFGGLF